MPYVYSFCQIFQVLRLFPALRLLQGLELNQVKEQECYSITLKILLYKPVVQVHSYTTGTQNRYFIVIIFTKNGFKE